MKSLNLASSLCKTCWVNHPSTLVKVVEDQVMYKFVINLFGYFGFKISSNLWSNSANSKLFHVGTRRARDVTSGAPRRLRRRTRTPRRACDRWFMRRAQVTVRNASGPLWPEPRVARAPVSRPHYFAPLATRTCARRHRPSAHVVTIPTTWQPLEPPQHRADYKMTRRCSSLEGTKLRRCHYCLRAMLPPPLAPRAIQPPRHLP
jgi:hypothetical protein